MLYLCSNRNLSKRNYMLKIGVLGVGHLGRIHLNCIRETGNFQIMGFFDTNDEKSQKVIEDYNIPRYSNYLDLIDDVDVIDIVTPTYSHFAYAKAAITRSRHVFIEKPLVQQTHEAEELIKLAEEAEVVVQVGHVERFNPAFLSIKDKLNHPLFIESHRLSNFNPRGLDVPVIFDLMIHDIDIVLGVLQSRVKRIHASGLSMINDSPDIANARLEFDNGAVANLTTSRIALKDQRTISFYQEQELFHVDFLNKSSEIVQFKEAESPELFAAGQTMSVNMKKNQKANIYHPKIVMNNAIKTEFEYLHYSIINNKPPVVNINDGYEALLIAQSIIEKLKF